MFDWPYSLSIIPWRLIQVASFISSWLLFIAEYIYNTLATSCKELTHWKRPWCWEGLGAGGEGDDRGWDGWMASPTQWTWVWINSRNWWWTGRPGMLQFMGSQRVGHDWANELNWTDIYTYTHTHIYVCMYIYIYIPWYGYTTFFLTIHQLKGIWARFGCYK